MSKQHATFTGFLAILVWSLTAVVISFNPTIPSLFLAGTSLLVGFFGFCLVWLYQGASLRLVLHMPPRLYIAGALGLTGYYGFYTAGLHNAPLAEANLINYLWPIFLLLLSSRLPGATPLRWYQILGAFCGLAGVFLIIASKQHNGFFMSLMPGHVFAFLAAIIWASYSTFIKTCPALPSHATGVFLFIASIILLILHGLYEPSFYPDFHDLIIIFLCGVISPLGNVLWNIGMQKGHITLLAVLSFIIPCLSTCWLILAGHAQADKNLLLGGTVIATGILMANLDKCRALLQPTSIHR